MNLYLYELKSSWKSLLVWIVCIIGFLVFALSMFPSFSQMTDSMDEMLSGFSPEMLKALGMDFIDFSKPMDYMAYMYQYLLVAVGAFAVLAGGSALSKEEAEKTIEFLYAKPVSRKYIAIWKIAAAFTKAFIMALAFYLTTLIGISAVSNNINHTAVFNMSLGLFIFMLIFLGIGLFIGHFIIKTSKRLSFGLGILFLMYLMAIMSDINDKLETLRYVSPFKYVSGIDIIHNGFTGEYIIISAALIIATVAAAAWMYQKKDLSA